MRSVQTVTIADGASVSGVVDLGLDGNLSGIITDSGWNATGIQVEGSWDGVNFFPVFDGGTLMGVTSAVASTFYVLDVHRTVSVRYVRLRSGTSAVPVAQTGATTLTVISGHFV